jgi:predicted amidohydrolase
MHLWEIEQVSHAIANGYWVGAINRVGVEPLGDNDFYGTSYFCNARGEIDPLIDPELALFVIMRLIGDLGTLIAQRLGLTHEDAAHDIKQLAGPAAERIYDDVLQILQYGLGAKNT